ncbi:MAG: PAS domain S-box protein, partial [Spirochaetales bacterium]|nr:PAS domain S-box protein [Spirochaetales bacterium]
VAVRDAATVERLTRELKSCVSGVSISSFVSESRLREAITQDRGHSIDVLLVDQAMAESIASYLGGDDAPVVAVLTGKEPDDELKRLASEHRYALLAHGHGHGGKLFAEAASWVAGVITMASRRRRDCAKASACSQRYEDLVHALPDIVYELDVDGVITFVNESVSILGYRPDDLIGKHYSVLLHDDDAAAVDRDRVLPDFAGYRTGVALSPKLFNERRSIDRRTTDLEVRLRKKPGAVGNAREMIGSVISYGEVSSAGEYARNQQDGEFKGSVGIIRDVTLRRKSEEMLRKLYQAVDQLGSCVFVLNHAFEIEYVNPAFFLLTGFSPPDVIGRMIFRFFAFMPEKVDILAKRIHDGFDASEEVLVPRATGGQFWANFSVSPVRSPSGAITHAIAIVEDVSSRKSMEALVRNARGEAEAASKAKSCFLSHMTHELKNPITSIISAARLLELTDDDAP